MSTLPGNIEAHQPTVCMLVCTRQERWKVRLRAVDSAMTGWRIVVTGSPNGEGEPSRQIQSVCMPPVLVATLAVPWRGCSLSTIRQICFATSSLDAFAALSVRRSSSTPKRSCSHTYKTSHIEQNTPQAFAGYLPQSYNRATSIPTKRTKPF